MPDDLPRPPRPRRAPKLYKHPRTGFYYSLFFDADRQPKRKWFALATDQKRRAMKLHQQADEAYFAGSFDPWRDGLAETGVPVAKAIDRYLAAREADGTWRPTTARWQRDTLGRFAASLPAGLAVQHVRADDVRAWAYAKPSENAHASKSEDTRTAQTRRTYLSAVRQFFAWCIEAKLAETNPADDVRRPDLGAESGVIEHLRPEQFSRLLALIRAEAARTAAMRERRGNAATSVVWLIDVVEMAAYTGLRLGELHRLRWQDVDLEGRTLYVRNTARGKTKTGRERAVPLVGPAVGVLRRLEAARVDEAGATPVLLSPARTDGLRPFSKEVASRRFREFVRLSGLPVTIHFHSLRKTFATWLASTGVQMQHVQQALGHANLRTTAELYASVWDESTRAEMDRAFASLFGDAR